MCCVFVIIILFSCRKSLQEINDNAVFPTIEDDKKKVALIKEVASILETVYKDPYAYYEVNTAIYSEFYEDERVLLKDLLLPESSALYKTQSFLSFKAEKGRFAKIFLETMKRGKYPLLQSQLNRFINKTNNSRDYAMIAVPADTAIEIFSNSKGVSIYFPYSENFRVPLTTSYFDKVNTPPYITYLATIVAADREADSGPGKQPDKLNSDVLRFIDVTVNDDYAEQRVTHIVGSGADPRTERPMQPQDVNVVFLGEVLCNKQYDNFINFSHLNGGGPDLRFMRGDGFLQPVSGQISNAQNTITVDLKRKDCRRGGRWKKVYAIWDSNWQTENLNQVFGIWEEDKSGTQAYTGTVSTTLTNGTTGTGTSTGNTTVSTIGYSISVTTKDPIIRQMNWNRESFFMYNRGGLNNGCGTKDGWTIYDCNQTVRYTLPTQ